MMSRLQITVIKIIWVALLFTIVIAICYIYILPSLFHNCKTYSVIVIGAIGSAVLSGYYSYRAINMMITSHIRCLLSCLCGLIIAMLVIFLSLLVIVNVRGL